VSLCFIVCAALTSLSNDCNAQFETETTTKHENIARIPIGVSFYNSGWYNCVYYYPGYACGAGNYNDYVPFTTGLQFDIHLGEQSYLTPGFQVMIGSVNASYFNGYQTLTNSSHETLWEPTLDYIAKGDSDSDIRGRLRAGAGVYLGSDGHAGAAFRFGGGGSFFNTKKIGLGLDVVFEGGSYNGYWIGGLQLIVSPELHF
jgi:hypothetical protein